MQELAPGECRSWDIIFRGEVKKEKAKLLMDIDEEKLSGLRNAPTSLQLELAVLKKKFSDYLLTENTRWRQRARGWLKEGDANTKYFHAVANDRNKVNLITEIQIDNNVYKDPLLLPQISLHFKSKFQQSPSSMNINWEELHLPATWDSEMDAVFSEDEIKRVLFESYSEGAPGPDDSVSILSEIWSLVKQDIYDMMNNLHKGNGK